MPDRSKQRNRTEGLEVVEEAVVEAEPQSVPAFNVSFCDAEKVHSATFVATEAIVSDRGELILGIGGQVVGGFAPGVWQAFEKVEVPTDG